MYNKKVLLIPLLTVGFLFACTFGGENTVTSSNNNSQLAQYKAMLKYTPLNQKTTAATSNSQQSMIVTSTLTLSSIDIQFFSNNNCDSSNNGLKASISLNGGESGTQFNPGSYSSTATSNFALCGRYVNGSTSNSGCNGLYTDFSNNNIQSMRFNYNYAAASNGPGAVAGGCMSGSSDSSYKETILNWTGNNPWASCNGNTNCGFSQAYSVDLPATYSQVPSVVIAPVANWSTLMGSAFAFSATISNGSSLVTPSITGIDGILVSPSSCNLSSSATESCIFIVTPYSDSSDYSYWNPSSTGNSMDVDQPSSVNIYGEIKLTIATSANATVNGSAAPLVINNITGGLVIAPYIYLPAPTEGDSTESNTGVTWGSGGVIDPRFEDGSQSGGGSCSDSRKDNLTELEWLTDAGTIGVKAWTEAQQAVTDFNNAGGMCGYTDWRVPTVNELRSLINYQLIQNSYTVAGWLNDNGFTGVSDAVYWSSNQQDPDHAFSVYFFDGAVYSSSILINTFPIWGVRGGQ